MFRFGEDYLGFLQLGYWILVLELVRHCGERLGWLSSVGYLDRDMNITISLSSRE